MRDDTDIQRDVQSELEWAPDVDERDIAVKVNEGVVTLAGYAPSCPDKHRAEAAVKRVAGVVAVANDIAVRLPSGAFRSDPEIARDAVTALKCALPVNWQQVKPLVHQARVALEGDLDWHFERERAENAVRHVPGVVSVRNSIRLTHRGVRIDIKENVEAAFRRSAAIDAEQIRVEASGSEVTLRGKVRSWAEREQAVQAAWAAPGVTEVKIELLVCL